MGNTGSSGGGAGGGGAGRRRNHGPHHQHHAPSILPPPAPQQQPPTPPPEVSAGNRYVFAAATPYPQYPNPNSPHYYQYVGSYPPPPPMPAQMPAPFDHYQRNGGDHPAYHPGWASAPRYPYGSAPPPPPTPFVEHQKAVTIRNDVNLKKETLRIVPDEENRGRYLVTFTFDATVSGSISVLFFAKEGLDCNLTPTKDSSLAPVTVSFKDGLGQKFKQSSGAGIDLSMFEEAELTKEGETDVYPLAIKAEACPADKQGLEGSHGPVAQPNSQITQAVFEKKENGEYRVRVVKQILWVNGTRYELQEIYGIGNSVDGDFDGNDPGKECVICLSEPRDTTVLPCRHMCMCSGCAKVLRYQTNRCPICRQPVERLLEIKVNNRGEDEPNARAGRSEQQQHET